MSAEASLKAISQKVIVGWILSFALAGLFMWLVPESEIINFQQKIFFAVTLFFILLTAFELVDNIVIAFMLPVTYLLLKLAPSSVVFSPWSGTIPWMVLGGFIMANVLERIGLLKRLTYWCVLKAGASYQGIIWGLAFAGIILNLMAPGKVYIPMATIAYGLCVTLDLGKSKASAGIIMAACYAALVPMTTFLYTPSCAALMYSLMNQITPTAITWLGYFGHMAIYLLFYFGLFFMITKVFKADLIIEGKPFFQEKLQDMGNISASEKKALILVLLFLVYMLTGSLHKLDMAWGFVFIACAFYLPFIRLGTKEDLNKVPFVMVMFIAAFMSIGSVSSALGVGKLLASLFIPFFDQSNQFVLYGLVMVTGIIANFLLTPLAGYSTLIPPLTQIALDLGLNPVPVIYALGRGLDEIILPYEIALYLIFFSYGLISLKDFVKINALKMIFALIFFMAITLPYWKLIGLI